MLLQEGLMAPMGAQLWEKNINSTRGTWNHAVLGSPSSPGAWALLFSPPAQHLEHSEVPVLPPHLAQLCNNSPVGTGSSSIMGRRQKEFYTTEVKKNRGEEKILCKGGKCSPRLERKNKNEALRGRN